MPHSLQTEVAVIGGLLADGTLFPLVNRYISAEDFYDPSHQVIFSTIADMSARGKLINRTSVYTRLEEIGRNDITQALPIQSSFLTGPIPSLVLEQHAITVLEKATRRQRHQACVDAAAIALNEKDYSTPEAMKVIYDYISKQNGWAPEAMPALEIAHHRIQDALYGEPPNNPSTGFASIDAVMGGLPHGHLVLLAGRPGMGKTQLACDIALNASRTHNVLFCTLEMTKERLIDRMICADARVSGTRYRRRELDDQEKIRVALSAESFKSRNLKIIGGRSLATSDIRGVCYAEKMNNGLDVVVIDYLSKIADRQAQGDNTNEHLGKIVHTLQDLAIELNISVLLLCQLSRKVETRVPPIPNTSDLRDSGHLEQDADVVMMVYREEFYSKDSAPGEANIIITKLRDGATGICRIRFSHHEPRFYDAMHVVPSVSPAPANHPISKVAKAYSD